MKRVNLRQFQRKIFDELKELPLVVTRNKEDSYIVLDYTPELENTLNQTTEPSKNEDNEENQAQTIPINVDGEEVEAVKGDYGVYHIRQPEEEKKDDTTIKKKILSKLFG